MKLNTLNWSCPLPAPLSSSGKPVQGNSSLLKPAPTPGWKGVFAVLGPPLLPFLPLQKKLLCTLETFCVFRVVRGLNNRFLLIRAGGSISVFYFPTYKILWGDIIHPHKDK
eukprot:FR737794.1.p2 GENE.FR737794.1~~FR737794.1.p2  ORF type:complete len:111 (+),score=16.78 FR737794.1:922-1254(+)